MLAAVHPSTDCMVGGEQVTNNRMSRLAPSRNLKLSSAMSHSTKLPHRNLEQVDT
jgi:hypothetical protein